MTGNSKCDILRMGNSQRYSDVVIHSGTAHWVEVAEDIDQPAESQILQVLNQIDLTLQQIGSTRNHLLQILVYLSDLQNISELNRIWDEWVPKGHAPVRACVGVQLGSNCLVEMVITAACP